MKYNKAVVGQWIMKSKSYISIKYGKIAIKLNA